jgi:hypothetical protein
MENSWMDAGMNVWVANRLLGAWMEEWLED